MDSKNAFGRPPEKAAESHESQYRSPEPREANQAQQGQAPAISLPKGGGAIRGMGEKFAANPATGTGTMTVPIPLSAGREGFGPELSLAYDSGSGNGPFGFGWSLAAPAITRKTEKGLPRYLDAEESDVFLLSGSEDLVPVLNPDGSRYEDGESVPGYTVHRYRPRIEGLFARIERWTRQSDGDVHWRSWSRENLLTVYGKNSASRIADPLNPAHIFAWLICETRDAKGNGVVYDYKAEDGTGVELGKACERNRGGRNDPRRTTNRYLKRIRYGNRTPLLDGEGRRPRFLGETQTANAGWMFEVVLDYGEHDTDTPTPGDTGDWGFRADPFSSYRAGFEIRTARLCRRLLMFHHFPDEHGVGNDCLVRSLDFSYSHEKEPDHRDNPIYTFLLSIVQHGYRRDGDGYLKRAMPPVEFEYSRPEIQDRVEEIDPTSMENLPVGLDGAAYRWTDLHGEGVPGILAEQASAWFYKRNLSPMSGHGAAFAPLEAVALKPNHGLAGETQLMDLDGDGQPDLVVLDGPMPGLYRHDRAEGWQPFRPFTSRLNRKLRSPNLKLVDLDGDGHADVLITEEEALVWHPSLVEEGFGPEQRIHLALDEEQGPRLLFGDGEESIYLADLGGDGLADLVRIRNGEICYWPNLGYGRFGTKIAMDGAPLFDRPESFDQKRIRLADIDGSGTADLIYLHREGVRLYFNQSGNGWSEPRALDVYPRFDDLVNVVATDLLGNGTACLVWSSPLPGDGGRQLRYLNLMGGTKPHLLIGTANNLGAETRVGYATSTKFYLRDKYEGRPWITKLPFPVHVVERIETHDRIGRNRFVTRYAYHHGHFDGEEREFRGFGMVERWDTEEIAALSGTGTLANGANRDPASHVPPVLTKTWFHTGSYLRRDHISDYFAGLDDEHNGGEYFREPGLTDAQARSLLLPDSRLPSGLSLEEEREACRALKGTALRSEVFALDGSQRAAFPYTVVEGNRGIRLLQPRGDNRHAVFFAHAREAVHYHYERNPADPRIRHELTLQVDDYGNVLKKAEIGYGRRLADTTLPLQTDREKQTRSLITYTEERVTRAVDDPALYPDDYRVPIPCETETYELTGLQPENNGLRFSFEEWTRNGFSLSASAMEIPYEQTADNLSNQKRLIECVRTLFRKDDLTDLLPLGEIEPLALEGETYRLAFTPGLLARVYVREGRPLLPDPAAVLGGTGPDRGGYVDLDGDGRWWVPGGRVFLSPDSADNAGGERAFARTHFFLPHRFRNPFGAETVIAYDAYNLLLKETRDPLGNRVTVGERLANGDIDPTVAGADYRVLKPQRVMDPNRNRIRAAFDALGMVVGTAVMGKPGENLGDSLDGFEPDLSETALLDHLANPLTDPHAILKRASVRTVYDPFAYVRTKNQPDPQPAAVYTLKRETHDAALGEGELAGIHHDFSYSDGFGREIQKKVRAEPETVNGVPGQPRWIVSGWTVFNNKGKPVRQYEPFFSDSHGFEFGIETGVSPILFYDPMERAVATLHPNHCYEKTVFDPWRETVWDVNDTVLADPRTDPDIRGFTAAYFESIASDPSEPAWQTWHAHRQGGAMGPVEQATAGKTAAHADTPGTAVFDTLGRPFLTVARNRVVCAGHDFDGTETDLHARVELDIEGNEREIRDAAVQNGDGRGRIVMRYAHDMLGNRIRQVSMEAGPRWTLNDVAGNTIRAWDGRGHGLRSEYDPLGRLLRVFVTGADNADPGRELLTQRLIYGERHPQAEARNLRATLYLHLDQAGAVAHESHDFKGNLLSSSRRLAADYTRAVDWAPVDAALPAGSGTPFIQADLDAALAPLWEAETFSSAGSFDALNRPLILTTPHTAAMRPNRVRLGYNQANLLERVEANLRNAELGGEPAWTPFVAGIDYDAKGQRRRIDYGNGVSTVYQYDPLTFRLVRLHTRRNAASFPDDCPDPQPAGWPGCGLQNLHYSYDPAGNVTHIRDDAQQTVYFRNKRVSPDADYTYDALYRLVEAKGREHLGQVGGAPVPHSHHDGPRTGIEWAANDGNAMGRFVERFLYDAVGNILQMKHRGSDPLDSGWTRTFAYGEASQIEPGRRNNRLSGTWIGDNNPPVERYVYDEHGNMTRIPHLGGGHPDPNLEWDHRDRLRRADLGGGGNAFFTYDSGGERVRKVWEKSANLVEERLYLGGFEIFRRRNGAGTVLERETLHLMDDRRRIALVETRTRDTAGDDPAPPELVRYQCDNHLGSASLELDEEAQVISYEEYTPYGSSSYQAVRGQTETPKRYRYTGMERDEESGLSYHHARYYAPWLGRWLGCDPAGLVDGPNLYRYCRNNPVSFSDPSGMQHDEGEPVDLGPFQLGNFSLTGLSGGAQLQLNLQGGFGSGRPFTFGIHSASLSGDVSMTSSLGIPSLGLSGGTASYQLNLGSVSIDDNQFHADVRGRARLETGPLSISFLTYADVNARIDPVIYPGLWRQHLQHTLASASGTVEVFATPRLGGIGLGFFALRAESTGGGVGTTYLSGRLPFGRISGAGSFTTGYFLDGQWVPGTFNLSGSFWALGPGVAFGSWAFDLNQGLSASGHYFGTQFGPFGLNLGINPTGNVTDEPTPYQALTTQDPSARQGAVMMYEPGTSFGYTFFHYSQTHLLFLSLGFAPSSAVVPYYGGGLSQPEIPILGTFGVGPTAPDAGWYLGGRLNWSF